MEHQKYIAPEETPVTFIHFDSLNNSITVIYYRPADGKKYFLKTPPSAFKGINMLLKNNLKYTVFYRDGQPCGITLNQGYCYYQTSDKKLDMSYQENSVIPALLEHFVRINNDENLRQSARTALKILCTVSCHPHDVRNFADSIALQVRYQALCGDTLDFQIACALAEDLAAGISLSQPEPDDLCRSKLMKLFTENGIEKYLNHLV